MAIRRYKPAQIVTLLRQIEVGIGNGKARRPSLDAEQRRATEEGLNEQELALFYPLFKENITRAEREQSERASRRLLISLQTLIGPMPLWTENASTQAGVQSAILDQLYRDSRKKKLCHWPKASGASNKKASGC